MYHTPLLVSTTHTRGGPPTWIVRSAATAAVCVLSAGLWGCGIVERASPTIVLGNAPAFGSLALGVEPDGPREPGFFVAVSDTQVAAVDRASKTVWLFGYGTTSSCRLLTRLSLGPQVKVVAMAATNGRVVTLDSRGVFRTIDAVNGRVTDSAAVHARSDTRVIGVQPLSTAHLWLLGEKANRDAGVIGFVDSLILAEIDVNHRVIPAWSMEKVGARPTSALLADYSSMTARGDTVWIAGASPPRVQRLVGSAAESIAAAPELLKGGPVRRVSAVDRQQLRQEVNRTGLATSVDDRFDAYPSVARAWPLPDGYVVLAGTSASTFALDRYCGTRFRETTLQSPDVVDVAWFSHVVVVRRRDPTSARSRLDFYSPDQLAPSCASRP